MMNKAQAAYLAGLIDGEGYIALHPNRSVGSRTYYQPILKIGMTHKETIVGLQKSFGGSLEVREYENPNFNDAFTWSLNGKNLRVFLLHIEPYLRIKRRQAQLLLEKYKMQEKKAGMPYSEQEQDQIEEMYREMRSLNRRGKLICTLND